MCKSCTSNYGNTTKVQYIKFYGVLKGKSTLMVYDRYLEIQSKRDKEILCGSNW